MDILHIASFLPLIASAASLIAGIVAVRASVHARKAFVKAMEQAMEQAIAASLELEKSRKEVDYIRIHPPVTRIESPGERLGDNDPALVRSLYFSALRDGANKGETSDIVIKALNRLAEVDKKQIKYTLNHNSKKGRLRYLDSVFKRVFRGAT